MSSNRGVGPFPFDLLVAVLRDGPIPADLLPFADVRTLTALARAHGVLSLIAERLAGGGGLRPEVAEALRIEARAAAAVDLVREAELRDVLAALAAASIHPIALKGAQLAYSHYPRPDLRPRLDADLMIADCDRERVRDVLAGLGYEEAGQVAGELVMSQTCYVKRRGATLLHTVDVHWKLANPQVFAGVLTYEEMTRSAQPLPALSPVARGLSDVHALLVACIHRVAHHFDAVHLIWLYDIHLLASRFDDRRWRDFVALAADRGVASVTRQSLVRAHEVLGAKVPDWVLAELGLRAGARAEPSAAYVSLTPASRRQMRVLVSDLRALGSWGQRWRLVREHVFPPVRYMRDVYAPASRAPLYVLYLRRAVRGACRWIVRT